MPQIIIKKYNQKELLENANSLAQDCMISGIYNKGKIYVKKKKDNTFFISFKAIQNKQKETQVLPNFVIQYSKIDFNTLKLIISNIYKILKLNLKSSIKVTEENDIIKIIFDVQNEWKFVLVNLSAEEKSLILENIK